ncbi:MAG: hypothetical protein IT337_00140 [Thermomicrobiales bacterium]|nr:hypothetical protein [Thermomicrobiales bacterium]
MTARVEETGSSQPTRRGGKTRRAVLKGSAVAAMLATRRSAPAAARQTAVFGQRLLVVRDQRPAYGGEAVRGGTLRMARPAPSQSGDFNPTAFRLDPQVTASYLDPLLRPDDVTMEPRPWLAESWRVTKGGREIRYSLREGVRWHDGLPFTADDVVFSFDAYHSDIDSAVGNMFALYDRAEAVDERTVRVRLTANDPTWLFNASTLPIFQRDQYSRQWNDDAAIRPTLTGYNWRVRKPIGTGPWAIASWDSDSIVFEANRSHFATPPWFDRFQIRWVADIEDVLASWIDGDSDLLWVPRAGDLDRLDRRPARLYAADAASVMFAAFNFANLASSVPDVFDGVNVRRALSRLIDRDGYARSVFGGFANVRAAGTVAQPWAHDDRRESPRANRDAGRRLLEEAGWLDYDGDGFLERADGVPLQLTLIYSTAAPPDLARVLARVKLDLEDGGVDVLLEGLAPDVFTARWQESRDYDLIAYAYDLFPGFTDFDLYGSRWDVRRNAQGWNPGGYANPRADDAIDAYLNAEAIADQRAALLDLQRAVDEDPFALWLGFPQDLVLVAADVLGFQPNKNWQTGNTALLWHDANDGD